MIRIVYIPILVLFLFFSCKKDNAPSGAIENLSFSVDTIFFDTLFAQIPNVTKVFKVYNTGNEDVLIDKIFLKNNSDYFSFTINGTQLNSEITKVKINAKDSIWCFAKVNISGNNETNPFILEDEFVLQSGSKQNKLKVLAWGQNAHFYKATAGNDYYEINENTIWTNDLPHIIIGICKVNNQAELKIEKNTKVYFYNNSALVIDSACSLKILGELDAEVSFKPTRLESYMQDIAGQWRGIILNPKSLHNEINYLNLQNAQTGIKLDSSENYTENQLILKNTVLNNCSQYGIWSNNSNFTAYNTLISNCLVNALKISQGGKFNLFHCTLASYINSIGLNSSSLSISGIGFKEDEEVFNDVVNSGLYNCIVAGSVSPQININNNSNINYQITFSSVLVPNTINTFSNITVENLLVNNNPMFEDTKNFNLKSTSPAIQKGKLSILTDNFVILQKDLMGTNRLNNIQPDLGYLQYVKK
jgi:hypothetical protein